jgi:predicted RNA binding protein YcfA (HicA-like mRNA interferase family)
MSQWDKLLDRIRKLSPDIRFEELQKVLENYGYIMDSPHCGSSHRTFRKAGCNAITIPKHNTIKKVYIKLVRDVVESEERQ